MKYQTNRRNLSPNLEWVFLIVFLIFFIWLDRLPPASFRAKAEQIITRPIRISDELTNTVLNKLRPKNTQADQLELITSAKSELADELVKITKIEALEAENQALKDTLKLSKKTIQQKIYTQPIASYSLPMIAAGQDDGVRPGMMVSSVEGVLLGVVDRVSAKVSQVSLLSAPNSPRLLAKVGSEAEGLVKGNGKEVILTEIPREIEIRPGQRITTLGQPGFAAGELLGIVGVVKTDLTSPVHKITIDQLTDFYQVPVVVVHD